MPGICVMCCSMATVLLAQVSARLRSSTWVIGFAYLLLCGCDDGDKEPIVSAGRSDFAVSSEHADTPANLPSDLTSNLKPTKKPKSPLQITVMEGDELDSTDSTKLQIVVPKQHEPFVIEGAVELLNKATEKSDPANALRMAQSALAEVTRAEMVVLADVTDVSDVQDIPKPHRTVTMKTLDSAKGDPPTSWTLDMAEDPGSCGYSSPTVGTRHIFFLRTKAGKLRLVDGASMHAIDGGIIAGYPGLSTDITALKLAVKKGMEAMP